MGFPVFQCAFIASCPLSGSYWESLALSILSLHQIFTQTVKTFPNLFFSRLNSPSSFSLSFYDRCSSSSVIAVALHWTYSSTSISSLHWKAQNWTQHTRCVSAHVVEWRGTIASLNLLASLCVMQSRMLLVVFAVRVHCWLTVSWLSTKAPNSFSAKLLSSEQLPTYTGCFFLWLSQTIFLIFAFKILTIPTV